MRTPNWSFSGDLCGIADPLAQKAGLEMTRLGEGVYEVNPRLHYCWERGGPDGAFAAAGALGGGAAAAGAFAGGVAPLEAPAPAGAGAPVSLGVER